MTNLKITINSQQINSLDLSEAKAILEPILQAETIKNYEQKLDFIINYERDPSDPRELSEIPEIRLWFVRLDAVYPWLPFLLNWKSGELARYIAMLVPHQFHRTEGIQYNPEALEIFVMHKIFILSNWLKEQGIPVTFRLKSIAQILGYELEDDFLKLLD